MTATVYYKTLGTVGRDLLAYKLRVFKAIKTKVKLL